ncbi:P-loop containing nucleoside triphosphate hydrolase protein [Lentinus tigrinus ALCF2SS1-6]|uniref:DNA 3'-5' helicase n=1 Tax=Lentinus tigrinus ALCF2SS1-6 TaxID=1328759 RepID=A0A5C2RKH4_9APHY|nr:P-loop containing nucleoside triphosphate hydrolase protein [Lentinus tigrinus ALCF2SS1-6]
MAAVQWQKDLVVILPTGSGKSAVVATAARLESNKITAVFLPLRSLLSDWKRRLTLLDYPFEVYNPSRPHLSGQTPIVLVSLDAAGGTSWQQAVTSLRSDVRLNRMVFDEAHLVLTEGSYRGIMNQVKELRIAHVQFVLLSATIPPISISHLATSFTLATGDNTQVIRTVSNRPELSFKGPTTYDHLDSETLDLISLEVRTTLNIVSKNPVNRVLVFVQTVANGLVVAERLECEFYRGSSDKSLTNQDRENIAQRWYDGTYKVMVATDAFGPGNDYPSVRYVFVVGAPRGIVDFLQMAGRGGRDGARAEVQLYHFKSERFNKPLDGQTDHLGQQDFTLVLNNPRGRCWREIFTKFLDGSGHKCQDSRYNWPCPACPQVIPGPWQQVAGGKMRMIVPPLPPAPLLPGNPVLSPQIATRRPRAISTVFALDPKTPSTTSAPSAPPAAAGSAFVQPYITARELHQVRMEKYGPLVARVKAAMELFAGTCPLCLVSHPRGPRQAVHMSGVLGCPVMSSLLEKTALGYGRTYKTYLDWMKQCIHYGRGGCSVCFRCHIPFFHDMLHQAQEGQGNFRCEESHRDVVGSVVYWGFLNRDERMAAEEYFGQTWADDIALGRWLVKTERGEEYTNMIRMFLFIVDRLVAGQQ